MKYVLINYNTSPDWVHKFTDDFLIIDDSEEGRLGFPKGKVVRGTPIGNADYSKLGYLIDSYDDLPDIFLWSKSNLFKFITEDEFEKIKNNDEFTPILTKNHRTYSDDQGNVVCFYGRDGLYYEINNSWYLNPVPAKYFKNWGEWAREFDLPNPEYIPFAPGGSYILTRDRVRRYPKNFYEKMRGTMTYSNTPGEAQLAERSYYLLWKNN